MRRESPVIVRITRRVPAPTVVPVVETLPVFWTEQDACEALHIGESTLSLWRSEGMPYFKRGRIVLFIPSDVLIWLREQTIRETPPVYLRRVAS